MRPSTWTSRTGIFRVRRRRCWACCGRWAPRGACSSPPRTTGCSGGSEGPPAGGVTRGRRGVGAPGRGLVASADYGVLRRFRRAAGGEFYTGASRREIAVFYAMSLLRLERLVRPAYVALQVPVYYGPLRLLTPRFVRAARSVGVRVDVWTVNDPDRMREVLDLGADAAMPGRAGGRAR